jgi:hypothetical protein
MSQKERIINLLNLCHLTARGIGAALQMKPKHVSVLLSELHAAGIVARVDKYGGPWRLNPDRKALEPKHAKPKKQPAYERKPEPAHKPASKAVLPVREGAFVRAPTRADLMAGNARIARVN